MGLVVSGLVVVVVVGFAVVAVVVGFAVVVTGLVVVGLVVVGLVVVICSIVVSISSLNVVATVDVSVDVSVVVSETEVVSAVWDSAVVFAAVSASVFPEHDARAIIITTADKIASNFLIYIPPLYKSIPLFMFKVKKMTASTILCQNRKMHKRSLFQKNRLPVYYNTNERTVNTIQRIKVIAYFSAYAPIRVINEGTIARILPIMLPFFCL